MNVLVPQTALRSNYNLICTRLRQVRIQVCGRRGQSRFAFLLGLSPSTYNYYEKGRVPPVDVVDLAAKVSGAPLLWLIRGEPEDFNIATLNDIIGEMPEKQPKTPSPKSDSNGPS
ncbi:MAG: helix-turn-helix domain-containing protein [Phycisphaerae bacterium]